MINYSRLKPDTLTITMPQLGHGTYEETRRFTEARSLGSNMPGALEPGTGDHLVLIQDSVEARSSGS